MRLVRPAVPADLAPLQALYFHLNPQRPILAEDVASGILHQILTRPGCLLLVCWSRDALVATCMLATIPNLMRGGRPHALVENVVTHPGHRRQGHGRAVLGAALSAAWAEGAHQVILMSGRKDPGVHRFYENCGFEPGIRTGYVARAPHPS